MARQIWIFCWDVPAELSYFENHGNSIQVLISHIIFSLYELVQQPGQAKQFADTLLLFMLIGIQYSDISGSRDPWVDLPLSMLISNIPFLALITIHNTAQCNSTANLNILLGCPSRVVLFWKPRKLCPTPSSDIASYVFTLEISAAAKTSNVQFADTLLHFILIGIQYSDVRVTWSMSRPGATRVDFEHPVFSSNHYT